MPPPEEAHAHVPLLSDSFLSSRSSRISFCPSFRIFQVFRKPTEDAFLATSCCTLLKALMSTAGALIPDSSLALALVEDLLHLRLVANTRFVCVSGGSGKGTLLESALRRPSGSGILEKRCFQLFFRDGRDNCQIMSHQGLLGTKVPGLCF
jgi:hypothetical protein